MADKIRVDDQYRDATANPEIQPGTANDIYQLEGDAQIVTDPTAVTDVLTFTVPSAGAAVPLTATNAVTFPEEGGTISSVTYAPVSTIAAPTSGNGRQWQLRDANGVVATLDVNTTTNAAGITSGAATPFVITRGNIPILTGEETLQLSSSVTGAGVADPGGTLTVTFTL